MKFIDSIRPQKNRDNFIFEQIKSIKVGESILDAGAGSQRYRIFCENLKYYSQDFGKYTTDEKKTIAGDGVGGKNGYLYGALDYIGNVWKIDEKDEFFDNILCTEVFEHIPYPIETIKEFARLLKKGGKLILTVPSNCARHMDPFYYYSGFSDRWLEMILSENNFHNIKIIPVGDYYRWMLLETIKNIRAPGIFSKIALLPSLVYFYLKKPTKESIDTICIGYHVTAEKK